MDTLIPWKVWGLYDNDRLPVLQGGIIQVPDAVTTHVDFGSVTYEYKDAGTPRTRTFTLHEKTYDDGHVVITAFKKGILGGQPYEFTFSEQPKPRSDGETHWTLSNNIARTSLPLNIKLHMTEKYWILRFGMWPVLRMSAVWVCFLLYLLYLWYENS